MSNPIERQRQLREAAWEKQRAREEAKKPKLEEKPVLIKEEEKEESKASLLEKQALAEEQLRAARLRAAEETRRGEEPALLKMQRDVVAYLRGAHRAVPLSELDSVVMVGSLAFFFFFCFFFLTSLAFLFSLLGALLHSRLIC